MLVRKHFPAQRARRSRRAWKLKKLNVVTTQGECTVLGRQGNTAGKRVHGGGNSNSNNNDGYRNNIGSDDDDEAEFEDEIERDK